MSLKKKHRKQTRMFYDLIVKIQHTLTTSENAQDKVDKVQYLITTLGQNEKQCLKIWDKIWDIALLNRT